MDQYSKMKFTLILLPLIVAASAAASLNELDRRFAAIARESPAPLQTFAPSIDSESLKSSFPSLTPEPLFHAIVYDDGRPTEILADRLGYSDTKVQTGTPMSETFPFIGAVGEYQRVGSNSFQYLITCTGSLADNRTVLTAAHCIDRDRQQGKILLYVYNISDVRVRSGEELQAKVKYMALSDLRYVAVHPGYGGGRASNGKGTLVNDVAIMRLYEPLVAEGTAPICLANEVVTTDLVGAGWGMKNCKESSQETLRKAIGTVYTEEECNEKLTPEDLGVNSQHVCATFKLENGEPAAVAKGDSGGPLVSMTNTEKPVQIGIVSFGAIDFGPGGAEEPSQYCMKKDIPQVYAGVPSFKPFINMYAIDPQWC